MTKRLESALKQLGEEEIEQLTRQAELLAEQKRAATGSTPGWKLDWVGALRDEPDRSGVEAQETVMREWEELLEPKRPR